MSESLVLSLAEYYKDELSQIKHVQGSRDQGKARVFPASKIETPHDIFRKNFDIFAAAHPIFLRVPTPIIPVKISKVCFKLGPNMKALKLVRCKLFGI